MNRYLAFGFQVAAATGIAIMVHPVSLADWLIIAGLLCVHNAASQVQAHEALKELYRP